MNNIDDTDKLASRSLFQKSFLTQVIAAARVAFCLMPFFIHPFISVPFMVLVLTIIYLLKNFGSKRQSKDKTIE
ncbi:hypothetical protein CI266_004670 [Salmonella enterica subsp. enterica serovar Kotte]|nr:hypothetical protein [Salmonella enterica subsp. enterica serovar Kotte]